MRAMGDVSVQRVGVVANLRRFEIRIALLLAAGAIVRLVLAATLVHRSFDMDSVRIIDSTLRSHLSDVYATKRWPYPGGLLPWVLASGGLSRATGIDITFWFKLPSIAADLSIAWLVQSYLGLRGASERRRLAAAALVCLGPSFIAISGYDGQIDALAILPGVAAMYVWERSAARGWAVEERNLAVAVLIGVGGAIKTIPLLLVLCFLPRITGLAARVRFCLVAGLIPLVTVLPWLVTNSHSLSIVLNYEGVGIGPLALATQPALAKDIVLAVGGVGWDSLTVTIQRHGKVLLYVALGLLTALLFVRKPRPERASVLLWLTIYSFMPFFFFQYVIWGLPFFLMAGYVREVALAQALLLVPTILHEGAPWGSAALAWPYVVLMTLTWLFALGSLAVQATRVWRLR
jgi:hypothetical protein